MTCSMSFILRGASLPALTLSLIACGAGPEPQAQSASQGDGPVYVTHGVHNDEGCVDISCTQQRNASDPPDPTFPIYWSSNWTMYRVFGPKYADNLPPYDGKPPEALGEGTDYEVSYGASYYDSTWQGKDERGAMMEHYEKRCLPIFPRDNKYTCSFISLGEVAFFVTYPEDRPSDIPPVCVFSRHNRPPGLDFIKHLPYAPADGERLGNKVQGYSFWVDHTTSEPRQTGASPDRTKDDAILFGYAFESAPRPDSADPTAAPYRHPQSFYFSGFPFNPPLAPIVSQNYTNFAMVKPDPAKTWAKVSGLDPNTLPYCDLFTPPGGKNLTLKSGKPIPTWGTIGHGRRQKQK